MEGFPGKGKSTLRTHSEFRLVFKEGRRFFRNGIGFHFRKANGREFRFGMSVPKRFGKAVERNLLRRRLREIIRLHPELPEATDVVICIRKPCREFSFAVLKSIIDFAFGRISGGASRIGYGKA